MLTQHFSVTIDRVMFVDEALDQMRAPRYDLVLLNRLIFDDGSEGLELVRRAKSDPELKTIPIMMLSNFPEAQSTAVAAGAEPGFGKATVSSQATVELLSRYLPHTEAGKSS